MHGQNHIKQGLYFSVACKLRDEYMLLRNVGNQLTTKRHIPEDQNPRLHRTENLEIR